MEDRLRIVETIWDSVASEAAGLPLQAWQAAELDQRLAEFDANPDEGLSWAEVKKRVMGA